MTDITTTLQDLDAGIFLNKLEKALSEVALGVVSEGRIGKVAVEFKLEQIGNSSQVNMTHKLKYDRPTARGKLIEEDSTETPLYVGKGGTLTLLPTLLPDTQEKFNFNNEENH